MKDENGQDDIPGGDAWIKAAARLSKAERPQRDLWPEIEMAISAPVRSRAQPWLAQAAAAVLLVAASSGLTYYATTKEPVAPTVVSPAELFVDQASFGGRYNMGADFVYTRESLRSQFEKRLSQLSPESRAEVEHNIELIRKAIAEIGAELEQQPDNVLLQDLLLRTYHEELNVMRHVGGLTQSVVVRNDI